MRPGMIGLSFRVENHLVHGVFYYAGGDAPNPTVVICHGFPGFEKNGDIAHFLHREGFNVLLFSYRGAWGSQGDFAFSNVIEDTCRAVRYISGDDFPLKSAVDKKSIAIVGHSMGGFAALTAGSRLPEIKNIVAIACWNIGFSARESRCNPEVKSKVDSILSGATVLRGTTADALWSEIYYKEDEYDICSIAKDLSGREVLLIAAKNDEDTPVELNHIPLFKALKDNKGLGAEEIWLETGHSFSDKRVELSSAILTWLDERLRRPEKIAPHFI